MFGQWFKRKGFVGDDSRSEISDDVCMKNLISILLENEPGALSRVVALFSARGYNIESLSVLLRKTLPI